MTTTFYAAVLQAGGNHDLEKLADQLKLACSIDGMQILADRVVRKTDGLYIPVYISKRSYDEDDEDDVRDGLARVVSADIAAFGKVEPKKADGKALKKLLSLSGEDSVIEIGAASVSGNSKSHELVGLKPQRGLLDEIVLACGKYGRGCLPAIGFSFEGPPGTGKTELAMRLLGQLDEAGVTDGTHNLVHASGSSLVGRYVGSTYPKVKATVEKSRGGLLLLDEFYGLRGSGNHAPEEALAALVEQLDLWKDEVIPVICGYEAQLRELFSINPGLRSRVPYKVEFDGYGDDELSAIFESFATSRGFNVSAEAKAALPQAMCKLRKREGFAQARSVRNLYQDVVLELAKSGGRTIRQSHIDAALQRNEGKRTEVRPVGFVRES